MHHRSALLALSFVVALVPLLGLQCGAPLECIDDTDCTGGADFCNAGGVCVDCIDAGDCDAGETCEDGSCGVFGGEGEGEPETEAEIVDAFCVHAVSCQLVVTSVGQCIQQFAGDVARVRAGAAEVCERFADAQIALFACATEVPCAQLGQGDLGGACAAELALYQELSGQAGVCLGSEGEGEGEGEGEQLCFDGAAFLPASEEGPIVFGSQAFVVGAGAPCDAEDLAVRLIVEHDESGVPITDVLASVDGENVLELVDLRTEPGLVEGVVCAVPDAPVERMAFQVVNEAGAASRVSCVSNFIGEGEGEGEGDGEGEGEPTP